MKIRTEEDVQKLDEKIRTDLGIDLQDYKNEEVVENVMGMLVFPEYAITWIVRPIIFMMLLFGGGYFLFQLDRSELIMYSIIGLVLFFLTGLLGGLWLFIRRMRNDFGSIVNYSLTLVKRATEDVDQVKQGINPENRKNVMNLLYKGMIHIVTLPMLQTAVAEKLPFLGGIVNSITRRVLLFISDQIKVEDKVVLAYSPGLIEKSSEDNYDQMLDQISTKIKRILSMAFGFVGFPIKVGFVVFLFILLTFLYFVH